MCEDLFVCTLGVMEPKDLKQQLAALQARNASKAAKKKGGSQTSLDMFSGFGSTATLPNKLPDIPIVYGTCRWVRISDPAVLARLVFSCMSDDTAALSSLRRRIASVFLTPVRMALLAPPTDGDNQSAMDEEEKAQEEDDGLFDDLPEGAENIAPEAAPEVEDNSSGDEMEVDDENEEEEFQRGKRGVPTKLVLQKKKGNDVPKRSTIQQESVFDEENIINAQEQIDGTGGGDNFSHLQYFSFAKQR